MNKVRFIASYVPHSCSTSENDEWQKLQIDCHAMTGMVIVDY